MAEQQLVDYVKKAKQAGQSDEQSRALLLKNGWTEAEISDAFAAISQPQARPQAQSQTQTQVSGKPKIETRLQETSQPQVQQQPQMKPAQNSVMDNMPRTKSGSHLILKLFVVLIIVVLLGGAGYFVGGQYLNLPYSDFFSNLFAPDPATVISKMTINMSGVKVLQSTIQGSINVTDKQNVSQGKALFSMDNKSDTTNTDNPKTDATLTIQITPPESTSSMSANMNIISVNNKFYIKINDIVLPSETLYSGLDISQIKGRFFEIDQKSVGMLSRAGGTNIDITQVNSPELVKKIQSLLFAENMFTVSKQLNNEVVSGQNMYHYLVHISRDKIKDLVNKTIASQLQGSGTDDTSFFIMSMAQSYINSFMDTVGDVNMELWIGKTDYMLYRFKIDKTVDLNKFSPGVDTTLTAKIDVINSNFGKPVSVQAPASAEKIEDVLLPLMEAQGIPADIYKIRLLAESIFGAEESYSSLCSHGLLNGYQASYGAELISLNNDIVSQGAKKPACFSGEQNYCISTQLKDGSFMCIDKYGIVGSVKCEFSETPCFEKDFPQ